MNKFFTRYGSLLKKLSLLGMLAIPFGLYHAAQAGADAMILVLLAAMGVTMIVAVKVG